MRTPRQTRFVHRPPVEKPPWNRRPAITRLVAALVVMLLVGWPYPSPAADPVIPVVSNGETTPVLHTGDAADDPAIWVNPTDPAASLIIGNDKKGALQTYNLDGSSVQQVTTSTTFWGNVDVRGNYVVAWNGGGARVYSVDLSTRLLVPATDGDGVIRTVGGEGLCLYQSATGFYVFAIARKGILRQYRLVDEDGDGLLWGTKVRQVTIGSESEGCVTDDTTGALYVSEEDVALWRYGAEPETGATRTAVETVITLGGRIAPDSEGVTVAGNYLIVSAQNVANRAASYFVMYDRLTNVYVKTFRVVDGSAADDCDTTDGIAAYQGDLGPLYPDGIFVCQDGQNWIPGTSGRQNFKLVAWSAVAEATGSTPAG